MKGLSLRHTDSLAAVYRLSYPLVWGILAPQPGIEPASPSIAGGFLTTGAPGKSPSFYF